MRKIFLYNHGGSENHGCEALVRTVCELFKEEDIILYSEMPQQDLHYGIQQFADVKSAKMHIQNCLLVLLKRIIA